MPVAIDPPKVESVTLHEALELRGHLLTPREREVAKLRLDGLPHPEIAHRLGTTHRAVRKAYSTARKKLLNPQK